MRKLILFLMFALIVNCYAGRDRVVQCGNLIFGGTHTSRCFSDEFLSEVQKQTGIPTERRFKSVKLSSKNIFQFPFVMMTGEKDFMFTVKERKKLKDYLTKGGFLLASAGCSSKEFDKAFRREIRKMFKNEKLKKISMSHPIFSTVKKIAKLKTKYSTSGPAHLEGLIVNGKLVMIYSDHGLNNTANVKGCCCCGSNEIMNSMDVNVNILVYALLH